MTEVTNNENRAETPRDALLSEENPTNGLDFELNVGRKRFDQIKGYCRSYLAAELLFSISILVADLIFKAVNPGPRRRGLPYQLLESTGEYVVNQVFNEEFLGETVSNGELLLYGAIVPFTLQMYVALWPASEKGEQASSDFSSQPFLSQVAQLLSWRS